MSTRLLWITIDAMMLGAALQRGNYGWAIAWGAFLVYWIVKIERRGLR